ncbi:unnamed protein product [Colias eurytheme]|nr:unnamed protein product [Colias eurytheme]
MLVLAVGSSYWLLSDNSIGSASAHPRPDELSIIKTLGDVTNLRLFEYFFNRSKENPDGSQTYLYQNVIQGSNTIKIHLESEVKQKNVVVRGNLKNGNYPTALTFAAYNVIQESNSTSINFLGSTIDQENITYNFNYVYKKYFNH